MGSCMSLKSSSSSAKYEKIIRVVHLNGRMEEFEDAITVAQVTSGVHFVFAQTQLACLLDSKPLDSATQLEMGNIYFLLPHSIFKTEMSPIDLATLSKRLTLAAAAAAPQKSRQGRKKKQKKQKSTIKRNRYADRYVPVPVPVPPPRINNTISDGVAVGGDIDINNDHLNNSLVLVMKQQQQQQGDQSTCSWKPILESITERSFTRAESDSYH